MKQMLLTKLLKYFVIYFLLFTTAYQAFSKEYFIKIRSNEAKSMLFERISQLTKLDAVDYRLEIRNAFIKLNDLGLNRVYVLNLPENLKETTLAKISKIEGIEYIEPVPLYEFYYTPNDYSSSLMWHLNKINAPQAWDIDKGGKGIVIGLVDDGMDTAHSDLQPVLWHNANEIKGNGIDDDANGYIDDYFGWDMADNDNDPSVTSSNNLSHGTHCAGIIGAKTDNNIGISAIGFNVRIMPLKCGRNGQPYIYNPYQGVEYAIYNGARIISMSWGGGGYSATYQTIFDVAYNRNIVCVAAAGNSGSNSGSYPAAYNHVISVGNTKSSDQIHSSSNYGTWVDVMAPGTSIYSSLPGNSYGYKTGTSMACPLVAGLCALMISKNPSMTNVQVENCLKSTCDNIDSQNSSYIGQLGSGRINAYRAMKCVKPLIAQFNSSKQFVCTADTMRYFDQSTPSATSWTWNFEGGTPAVSSARNPLVRYNVSGVYKVQLIAMKGADADTIEKLNYVNVGKPSVVFSGIQNINRGEFATIKVDFTGAAPWTLVYSDGNKSDTLKNIQNTPYYILKLPDVNTIYKPLFVYSGTCVGTVKDSTVIVVNQNVNTSCDSALRFHLTFGGSGDDQAYDIAVANDSNIYLVGLTRTRGAGNEDAFVAKLNNRGQVKWYRTFGGQYYDLFFGVTLDDRENVYLSGWSYPNSNSSDKMMLYAKLDKFGNVKWQKQLSGNNIEYMEACVVSKVTSKFIYFTGPVVSNSFGGEDFLLLKCDTNGNFIWSKKYGTSSYTDRPNDILEDEMGNIYIVGASNGDNLMIKTDSSGNLIFSKLYASSGNNETIYSMVRINSSIYMTGFCGAYNGSWTDRELSVMKTNLNGNVIWSKRYYTSSPRLMNSFSKIAVKNNRLFVAWSLDINNNDGLLMNLDTNGNILYYNSIGGNGNQIMYSMVALDDNSLLYAGIETFSGNNEVMLGKVNCKLKNLCKNSSVIMGVSNLTYSITDFTIPNGNISLTSTSSTTSNTYNVSTNITCMSKLNTIVVKNCKLNADFKADRTCLGDTVRFLNMSIDSNNFVMDGWYWDFGDGVVASGEDSVEHIYKNSGNYYVKLIVKSSNNGTTCSDTIQKLYISSDSFRILSMPAGIMICRGDSIQLAKPITGCGTGPYYYKWTPTTGIDNPAFAQPYFSPKISTDYHLEIKDYNGKTSHGTVKINLDNTCCKSKARFKTEKENICLNDSIRFINTSTFDPNSFYFKWKFTGANISTFVGLNPPKVIFNSTGIQFVELILSDICSNDTLLVPVFVYPLPMANAGRDTVICEYDSLKIGDESFGRNVYSWVPPAGLNNPDISDPLAIVASAVSYKLTVMDENACVNTDQINISIGAIPSFDLGADTSFCKGSSIQLNAPVTGVYLWNTGSKSNAINVNQAGTYWLRISIGTCANTDSINIKENPLPIFDLGNDKILCKVSLQLKPSLNYSNSKYLWNDGSIQDFLNVQLPGKFSLKITDKNQCSFQDSLNVNQGIMPYLQVEDIYKCEKINYFLSLNTFPGHTYEWYDNTSGPGKVFLKPGNYWVKAKTNCGDTQVNFKVVDSSCICDVWVPNVCSPNADGKNDIFKVVSQCSLIDYSIKIFSRWGELVFESTDMNVNWDGNYKNTIVPLGVYMYLIEFRKDLPDYKEYNLLSGTVLIIE